MISEKSNDMQKHVTRNLVRRMSFQQGIKTFVLTKEIIILVGILVSIILYTAYLINVKDICFGVVLDGGSSGTKATVYQWPCIRSSSVPHFNLQDTQYKKFYTPLAYFGDNISELKKYFDDIFEFVDQQVPYQMRAKTPVILGATAGMRLLTTQQQQDVIEESKRQILPRGYYFPDQKKDDWCQVISGQQEGAYLWATVNYLLNVLSYHKSEDASTVATIDLGGASTQIAFISTNSRTGYGKKQARLNVLLSSLQNNSTEIISPCYYTGYEGYEIIHGVNYTIKGTGIQRECSSLIINYLDINKDKCLFQNSRQCAVHNIYQSIIPPNMVIYTASGIQRAAHFMGFKNQFSLRNFSYKLTYFYTLTWDEVVESYKEDELPHQLFIMTYVEHLLRFGYNIEQDRQIHVPVEINFVKPGWNLALLMQKVSELSCKELYGQFCLDTVEEILN